MQQRGEQGELARSGSIKSKGPGLRPQPTILGGTLSDMYKRVSTQGTVQFDEESRADRTGSGPSGIRVTGQQYGWEER